MRPGLEKELVCIECGDGLRAEAFQSEPGPLGRPEVVEGCLRCGCGAVFPIIAGVPRLVAGEFTSSWSSRYAGFFERHGERLLSPGERSSRARNRPEGLVGQHRAPASELERQTAQSFAYEWERFGALRPEWEANFWGYMHPLRAADLAGQRILDAGCGSGRHAYHAGQAGAEVFAVDLGESVDVAYRNTAGLADVHVIQSDLRRLPFPPAAFDRVYSLGVLHHLPDPHAAFRSLVPYLREGGEMRIYLYWALEHAPAWQRALLQGVTLARRVTTRLPHPLLHLLSYPIAAGAYTTFVLPYRLLASAAPTRPLAEKLPLRQYAAYPFRVCVNDQFDRFSAPIERRYTRAEVLAWLGGDGLENPEVRGHFGWVGTARRAVSPGRSRPHATRVLAEA